MLATNTTSAALLRHHLQAWQVQVIERASPTVGSLSRSLTAGWGRANFKFCHLAEKASQSGMYFDVNVTGLLTNPPHLSYRKAAGSG
jgi:hypothetical protein